MSDKTEVTQRENIATPLGQDVIDLLRSQMGGGQAAAGPGGSASVAPGGQAQLGGPVGAGENLGMPAGGQFGLGVGPLQREAGTAIRQFVQSGAQLPVEMQNAIRDRQAVERERAMANLGERFSTSGLELGTPGQVGQARLLSELIPRQTEQFFQEQRAQGDQLMRAIMGLQTMGQQNIDPFMQLASQGILAPDVSQKENPWVTGAGVVGGLAQGAGSVMAASSLDFKENVEEHEDSDLDKIRKVKLYDYNYKGDDKRRTGVVVEDPNTPEEWIKDEKFIDLYEMMSTLTGAVAELADKVDELADK